MLQAPHIYVLSSVVPEADDLLLLIVHEPPLTASLGGTVLVAGAFLEHGYNLRRRPSGPFLTPWDGNRPMSSSTAATTT